MDSVSARFRARVEFLVNEWHANSRKDRISDKAHSLAGDRVSLMCHSSDEQHSMRVKGEDRVRLRLQRQLDAEHIIFFPPLHDLVEGTEYTDKGNDVFLEAFCGLLAPGHPLGMVCCEWGANIEQSKYLLQQRGCERHVHWCSPTGVVEFDRTVNASSLVADQFAFGAFR